MVHLVDTTIVPLICPAVNSDFFIFAKLVLLLAEGNGASGAFDVE
jgi:hypothetical protein